MKAIQRIKRLVKRITSMTLRGRCGGYDRASEGRDPRDGGRARPRPEERYASDFRANVLRQRPFLSLYSYLTSRRIFTLWRSRTYIQNLRRVRIAGLTSSFLLGLLALAIIIPLYNVSGTEDTEAASSYVPSTSSITFTSTRNKASINLTPTSTTGTFVQSDTTNTSEVASFNVATDNATGYTLGIASSTNTTSLTNGTDTLPTISTASGITASTFNTSTYNDMWGYLPSKYNSTANTGSSAKFYPMTTETTTLDETAAANSTANTYTIALGARVTMTKSSGTYTTPTGTAFILTAVGKPASYSITYNQNTTDTVSNLPDPTGVQSTSAQSITLSSAIPTRASYNFKGWCSASTSDLASGADASSACTAAGGTYYAGGTTNTIFYIDETTPNVTTLYAMWELAGYTITFKTSNATGIVFNGTTYTNGQSVTIPQGTYSIYGTYASKYAWKTWSTTAGTFRNLGYQNTAYTVTGNATITLTGQSVTLAIQNLSSGSCTTTARPVYDTRDDSVYWVQRLADGKCWMLDNLAFDAVANVNSITTSNTNTTQDGINALKSGGTSPYSATAISYTRSNFSTYTDARINVSGTFNSIAYTKDSTLVSMDAPTTPNHNKGAYGPGQGKVGVYYNYCAASGGTYCYSNSSSTGDASYDICPAGWHMPTGGSNNVAGSYYYLYNITYSADASNFRNILSTPLSGFFDAGSASNQGSDGYFWSSTRSDNSRMYGVRVISSFADLSNYYGRPYGYSVRCVLDTITLTANYGTGIAGVIVKKSSPEGATFGTVTTSGGSVEVDAGNNYYLLPLYKSGYTFSNLTASGGTRTSGTYGYYYYTPVKGTSNTVTISATTLGTTSSTNMQDLSDAGCTPYPMAVKDARDDEVYYVQRLADGKCWMLENLRLDLVGKKSSLTTANTNADSASLTSLTSGNRDAGNQYATAGVANWTSGSSFSAPLVKISDKTKTTTGYGPGRNYVGGYYNYCAASAGSYCYGDGTSYGTPSGNASYDICPAGWHMPSTTSSNNVAGSYYYLYNTAYSSNASNLRNTLSMPLSGFFYGGSAYNQGSSGYFWSSTRYSSHYMHFLYVGSSSVIPTDSYDRDRGYSVRCVTTPPLMQSIAVSDLAEGEGRTVMDARDGKDYTIKKINGYLWMTRNLRFTGTSLDTTNSNVTSDKTLTYYSLKSSDNGGFGAYSGHCDSTNSYNYACIYDSGSTTTGVWYNYYAASAGTISTNSNDTDANQDICPKNWHLPTGPNTRVNTDINKLVGNANVSWQNPTTGLTAFSAVAGGLYTNGSLGSTGRGSWWSATAYTYNTTDRYFLDYNSSNGQFNGNDYFYRFNGRYVRCVRTS